MSALKGDIWAAARGEWPFELAFLPVGGALFQAEDAPTVEKFILDNLQHGPFDRRIAATYASVFFLDKYRDVAILLTERVVLTQEPRLLLQASQEVLDIRLDTKDGGKCRRCGLTAGLRAPPAVGALEVRRTT